VRAGLGEIIEVETLKHPKYKGLLVHDLRRTGVRHNRRLVGESVAMKVSGHRTAATFKRYDIVDEAHMREVARKQNEEYEPRQKKQSFGRVEPETVQSEQAVKPKVIK
jgi:hypothetical protein